MPCAPHLAPLRIVSLALITSLAAACFADVQGASESRVSFSPRGDASIVLEGLLHTPPGTPPWRAVALCHPDPRHAGSMDVPVVVALQKAFAARRYATLRFNLRGVGRSGGVFDNGRGEVLDCLGAFDLLRSTGCVDAKRLGLVGYSYGSWVGLQARVRDGSVSACACLAFPVPDGDDPAGHAYLGLMRTPTVFVTGTEDTISSPRAIRFLLATHHKAHLGRVVELPEADHFLRDPVHLQAATGEIARFMDERLGRPLVEEGA